ncbi:CDC40 [Cordylochernes scorpioides]|uniref:CDC40 n=1 Tax=Cordylochernes scorpioides TaxID=51811 RepID=A0ABY6KVP6_9ARAC|nr:CDC40 [Cordylochernes scorpioides]
MTHQVESAHPGFTADLVAGLLRRADLTVNMAESLLRLQGAVPDNAGWLVLAVLVWMDEHKSIRQEDSFQELNRKSSALKRILSRIPDEINDRKTFLETIKEIASAIKKLLDAVNEVAGYIPSPTGKQVMESHPNLLSPYCNQG